MKRSTLHVFALVASVFLAGAACGQNKSAAPASAAPVPTPASTPAPKQQKLIRVATLTTPEANREFQDNVQLLQAQRQKAAELNSAMEKETDPTKKAALKTELEQWMAKLNENNDKMQKAYGFSLTRNYTMEIEKAHIYMLVSDEEAAAFEKAQKAEAQKAEAQKAPAAKGKK